MPTLKGVLVGMLAKLPLYVAILVALFAAFGWLRLYLIGPEVAYSTIYRIKQVPVVVKETKWSERLVTVNKCVETVVKQPTEKQKDELEKKYDGKGVGLDLDTQDLFGEFAIPKSPYGGEAIVTNRPGAGVSVIVKNKPKPFFEWGNTRAVGVSIGQGGLGSSWRVRYGQDLVRVGPVWFVGEASFGDVGGGKANWQVLATAEVRF